MVEVCKTWFCPTDFVLPLCTNTFEPVEGQGYCGLCVTPRVRSSNPCGCPDPLVDGPRLYRIVVAPGPSGVWSPLSAFYGTWLLNNNTLDYTGSACPSRADVPEIVMGGVPRPGGRWEVRGNDVPTFQGGKWWRTIGFLTAYSTTGSVNGWTIGTLLPACDNTTPISATPINGAGMDDWFSITLESL